MTSAKASFRSTTSKIQDRLVQPRIAHRAGARGLSVEAVLASMARTKRLTFVCGVLHQRIIDRYPGRAHSTLARASMCVASTASGHARGDIPLPVPNRLARSPVCFHNVIPARARIRSREVLIGSRVVGPRFRGETRMCRADARLLSLGAPCPSPRRVAPPAARRCVPRNRQTPSARGSS